MRRFGLFLLVLVVAALAFFGFAFSKRNTALERDEAVKRAWANVEAAYQRRLDLIPNLVETVKAATKFESETQVRVTETRNQLLGLAKQMQSALAERDPEKIDTLDPALIGAVRAFTGIAAEAYPNLKATDQFTSLQAEIAGTENRINVARRDYNDAVAALNTFVRQWGWMPLMPADVTTREGFKAQSGAEQAPRVKFD